MTVEDLARKLAALGPAHARLPVYLVMGKYEFPLRDAAHAEAGPLPHLTILERPSVPERIVLYASPAAPSEDPASGH